MPVSLTNVDRHGMVQERRAITAIQRLQGSSARKAEAAERRARRNAKRAQNATAKPEGNR